MPRGLLLVLLLVSQIVLSSAQFWSGSSTAKNGSTLLDSMSSFITAEMDVIVTTTASSDKVLLVVNLNMLASQQLSATAYTIFRGTTNLGGTVSMVDADPREVSESQSTSFSFLDTPGTAGTYTYSVRGKFRGVLSSNNQVRQIAALVIPSTIPSNSNLASTLQTISSTTPTSLNVDTAVSTNIVTDRVLVTATFSINPVGADAFAKINLFRDGVQVAPYAMQLVKMGEASGNRMGTFFFLDSPNVLGSVTYSVRVAKVGTPDIAVCEGGFDGVHLSTVVVPVVDSVLASSDTALLISSQTWTTCGLSAAIMPHSVLDKVLVTVNINFYPTAATSTGIFTIFRDGVNLGDDLYGLQVIKTPDPGESAVATMSFLDSPGTGGQVTYTVQVRALTGDTFTVSFGGQTRQIAVMASRAVAGYNGGCGFPVSVVTSANNRYRRLTLPTYFTLTFGLTMPTLSSGQPNIFDIRDATTGTSLLAAHRYSNTETKWAYNGINFVPNGLPLISGSIGVTPNVATVYTVKLLDNTITIQSTYQVGVWTTATITKIDTTNRLYDLYLSNGVDVSSLGTVSNIGITADAPPPSAAPTRIPTSKPTPAPSTYTPSNGPTKNPSAKPTFSPSFSSTLSPTVSPTQNPTCNPTLNPTLNPTFNPSTKPTINPSVDPTPAPTCGPTMNPTRNPTLNPTLNPTANPSAKPSITPSVNPTTAPTFPPTMNPTRNPTANPTLNPTANPSLTPTVSPSLNPTINPTAGPTAGPTAAPSVLPSRNPSASPSRVPSLKSTAVPTCLPTEEPSDKPTASPSTFKPTAYPTRTPSVEPSTGPTVQSSVSPSAGPSKAPSAAPSIAPSVLPTASPSKMPSAKPSAIPTCLPTEEPSNRPTPSPSVVPTIAPTASPSTTPTAAPTVSPTPSPSILPYVGPSVPPTLTPTAGPTAGPTAAPSAIPSVNPTVTPSVSPSAGPTLSPTASPSAIPSVGPSTSPTHMPSVSPSTAPSVTPSAAPSVTPTNSPSASPSVNPTVAPSAQPSAAPSENPSFGPTVSPTVNPTASPSADPSVGPTIDPTASPTEQPSAGPSVTPSNTPTASPTADPTAIPTAVPSADPSVSPTDVPTVAPTEQPSVGPSASPSVDPTADPTAGPTDGPTMDPSMGPTVDPTVVPSEVPSVAPTTAPTVQPTVSPTSGPTQDPSVVPSAAPSTGPTVAPTLIPSADPTVSPSAVPSQSPSTAPTATPTVEPTTFPSAAPSAAPSVNPTLAPTVAPTNAPSVKPTAGPTVQATDAAGIIVPAVPQLVSAAFNNAGSAIIVTFNSATNKAGNANHFTCSAILSFTGASTASCVWTDASTITVYPSSATLNVGSPVALISDNKVKAACPVSVSATVCASWSQATAASELIQAPASPTAPVVVFTASSTLSGCSPWSIDLSSSSGSGGRAWLAPVFTVTSAQGDGSAVAAFLNSGFSFSSRTPVPNALFPVDGVYTISVTLSNFLGASSISSYAVTVTKSSDAYPTVSIPGQDPRSVLTNAALLLTSSAFTIDCSGVKTTTNLAYAWTVSINGMVQTSLTSESLDTSRFRLSAFRLTPLKTYDILVTVTNTLSAKSSTASTSVVVQQGAVVAQVSGSGSQTVLVDGSLTLDASSSLDQDVATLTGTAAGLSFAWSCVQTAPEQSNTCPLTLSGTSLQTLTLTAPSTAAGSRSSITVTVTKGTRTSSATVFVTAQDSSAPLVAITTSTQSVTSVNANNRLSLSASVTAQSSCTAVWSVADSSVKLSTSALTPVSSVVPVGSTRVVNLVLAASALPERSSLAFTLACGESSAVITVTTNGPPLPGLFSVTPATGGIELSTSFSFSATFWSDTELPITYQFGFVSPSSGATLTVQGRSESSFATTTLAAGSSSAQYAVTVLAKVFDALNAASSTSSAVAVNPQTDSTALRASLTSQLTSNAGSTEGTKNAISVGSTVINAVSCSSAPVCASLNRAACAKVQNTCGACLTGYIGDSGDGNSLCVSATSSGSSEKTIGSTCSASDVCGGWLACDTTLTAPVCYLPSKVCADDCSGHGTCVALNANSRKQVTSCSAGDATCVVSCVCDESFSGPNCGTSSAELLEKQALRSQFLQSLSDVASTEDADSASVTALTNSLSSLAQNPYELSAESVILVNQVANSVLTSAATLGDFSYESAIGVLSAIDAAAAATVRMNSSNTASFANEMMQTIALFNSLVQSQLVAGQDGVQYIQDSFRLSSIRQLRGFNTSLKILSPTSLLEQSNGGKASTVTIDADTSASSGSRLLSVEVDGEEEEFAVDMVVTAASSYGSAGDSFNSNPVQLTVSRTASTPTRVTFVLVHNEAGNFTSREEAASMSFNSTCTGVEDVSVYFYECPGSNELLSHNCAGLSGVLTSYCPVRAPTCAILEGTAGVANTNSTDCDVLSFDLYSTTCSCLVQPSAEAAVRSRRLSLTELQQTGLLDAVSVTVYLGSEFKNTFNSADDLTSLAALQRVLIVIIMFSTLWAGGILLIFSCTWRRNMKKKANAKFGSHLEKKVQVAEVARSPAAVHQYLTDYVVKAFPSVFSNKPFFSRLYGEVKRHHRYLMLFTAPEGESGDKQRILTGVQLLSTQTMLMFLLAMLYDVESPSDDGSCLTYIDTETCLNRKSVFDTTVSYCDWHYDPLNDADGCFYRNPKFSLKVILYISVIVALLTALISYPTDLIFETLSAPVADEAKAAAQDSTITQIGKQATKVARRASNVAVSAAAAAKNKMARNSYIEGTVTRKLPGSTEAAHALATASMTVIAENSRRTIMNRQMTRMRSYHESGGKHGATTDPSNYAYHSSDEESDHSNADSDIESNHSSDQGDELRAGEITLEGKKSRTNSGASATSAVKPVGDQASAQLDKLSEEINCQRRLLKPSEVEEFDSQWGLDPTGEFTQGERSVVPCLHGKSGAGETIKKELQFVQKESDLKTQKLNIATDAHIGLEILHLFIMDLLGRGTPAAIIFETKSEEDFQHTKVVTRNTKRLAALALFCINAFFVYYAILTGFRKGVSWQQIYLVACIVQFFVEIFLFETMEVVWINCAIPVLVSDEVRRVGESIIEVVQQLCGNASMESRFFLNAPDYLFVSTNVAKQFPHLMESILVQAYQNHLPGEISHKWQTGSIARMQRRQRRRHLTFFGFCLRVLQFMGTAPFLIHRMMIRFLQPFVFAGLALLWQLVVSNVIYIAIAVFCVLVILAYALYRRYQEQVLMEKSQNVTPVAAADYLSKGNTDDVDGGNALHLPIFSALPAFQNADEDEEEKDSSENEDHDQSELSSIVSAARRGQHQRNAQPPSTLASDSEQELTPRSELSSMDITTPISRRIAARTRVPRPTYASSSSSSGSGGSHKDHRSSAGASAASAPAPTARPSLRLDGVSVRYASSRSSDRSASEESAEFSEEEE